MSNTDTTLTKEESAIYVRGLTVQFPKHDGGFHEVIKGLDLSIPQGQFVALVGKSGCGKTTLLNLIAGLVDQSAGDAYVLGGEPRSARTKLGFMMARDALLPWRNARKNVEYGLELRGVPKAERRAISARWLKAVHMDRSEGLLPWQLSQGMRQRVALARTWALDPEIFLMDEPFAALDANTRVSVQREFLELWQKQKGRTVIFVTHDLAEAVSLADRVILLGEGRILDDVLVDIDRPRDLEQIATHPRYAELFSRLRLKLDH